MAALTGWERDHVAGYQAGVVDRYPAAIALGLAAARRERQLTDAALVLPAHADVQQPRCDHDAGQHATNDQP